MTTNENDDGTTVRASVVLDSRAWKMTRAAAELLDMDLDDYIHDALERQLRAYNLPLAGFWAELNSSGDPRKTLFDITDTEV